MMIGNIQWGPPIPRDENWGDHDAKPDWLDGETPCAIYHELWIGCEQERGHCVTARRWHWHSGITAIKLPKEHQAYLALEKWFIPWGGARKPPADWNGLFVLFRNGCVGHHGDWGHTNGAYDIIGYKRRVVQEDNELQQPESPSDIARVTLEKVAPPDPALLAAREYFAKERPSWAKEYRSGGYDHTVAVQAFVAGAKWGLKH